MAKTKTAGKSKAKQSGTTTTTAATADVVMEPDVADVDPGSGKNEITPLFNDETWVILDGKSKAVPKEFGGKLAAVIVGPPTITSQDPQTGESRTETPPEAMCTVREAVQGAILNLPVSAFSKVYYHGRPHESIEPAAAGLA